MPTYEEKWNGMSVEDQAKMTINVQELCDQLLKSKDDIRLNDDYKEWIASVIIQIMTKNHFVIHHFHEFCKERDLSLFFALESCINNYKDSIIKQQATEKKSKESLKELGINDKD